MVDKEDHQTQIWVEDSYHHEEIHNHLHRAVVRHLVEDKERNAKAPMNDGSPCTTTRSPTCESLEQGLRNPPVCVERHTLVLYKVVFGGN